MLNPLEYRNRLETEALPRLAAALRSGDPAAIAAAEADADQLTELIHQTEDISARSVAAGHAILPMTKPDGRWNDATERW